MKRFLSLFLALLLFCGFAVTASAQSMPTEQVRIRDPYVLVHDGTYYMYGTIGSIGNGYGCYTSTDLKNWEGPFVVFHPSAGFDGTKHFWAPECHFYKDSFYLFATYYSESTGHRGTSVFRAESPLGPFTEISDGHATPHDQDSIDGTLYVENGVPYMVYVHEWTSTQDGIGRMDVARLSEDLTHFVSEPKEIFRADSPLWTNNRVTDGPFLYKSKSGRLLMLWSNNGKSGYCIGEAFSTTGVDGLWRQQLSRLYYKNSKHSLSGGHGMIFTDLDGNLLLCMHSPNTATQDRFETAEFLKVRDTGTALVLDETPVFLQSIYQFLDRVIALLFPVKK